MKVENIIGDTIVEMSEDIISLGFLKYYEDVAELTMIQLTCKLAQLNVIIRDRKSKRKNDKRALQRLRKQVTNWWNQSTQEDYYDFMLHEINIEKKIKEYNNELDPLYKEREKLEKQFQKLIGGGVWSLDDTITELRKILKEMKK